LKPLLRWSWPDPPRPDGVGVGEWDHHHSSSTRPPTTPPHPLPNTTLTTQSKGMAAALQHRRLYLSQRSRGDYGGGESSSVVDKDHLADMLGLKTPPPKRSSSRGQEQQQQQQQQQPQQAKSLPASASSATKIVGGSGSGGRGSSGDSSSGSGGGGTLPSQVAGHRDLRQAGSVSAGP
jgi:hypothetical protein